jgi:uncharacterized protein
VDLIFERTPRHENIDIGFFGGEPLLEFELIESVMEMITAHASYDAGRIALSLVTNGTIFNDRIAEFLTCNDIELCVSADGPPSVHDRFRLLRGGRPSATTVKETLLKALIYMPGLAVNAVYGPDTLAALAESVRYLADLGVRRIFLSPDYSADWRTENVDSLGTVYASLGDLYCEYYLRDDPRFVSMLDNKITVMLRGGYDPLERCRMGTGELAFAPSGNIYPCERLVGADDGSTHCLGNVFDGIQPSRMLCHMKGGGEVNTECVDCGIRDYCMNWCGCSNYFSSGYYDRVGTFLCASEQAAVRAALEVYQRLESKLGGVFMEHLGGRPYVPALARIAVTGDRPRERQNAWLDA